jgi:hypothetical protein
MNTARWELEGCGIQTLAYGFGGSNPGSSYKAQAETYDGSSWSEGPDLSTARRGLSGGIIGTAPSTIAIAGNTGSYLSASEEFNKSITVITAAAWSTGGNLGTARRGIGTASSGTQDAALGFGGGSTYLANTEEYNGSTWSEQNDLNSGRSFMAGAGTQTSGLAMAGQFPYVGKTEEYDGTSWSEQNDMPANARLAGCGTQTAGLAFGGAGSPNTGTYEYDGTNWTTGGSLGTARYDHTGAGLQTAALSFGGSPPPNPTTQTEEYNGTSWTTGGSLNKGRRFLGGAGIQTAALAMGGGTTPGNKTPASNVEQYDGTSWSTTVGLATARNGNAGAGTTSAGLTFGGDDAGSTSASNATEEFTPESTATNLKTLSTS